MRYQIHADSRHVILATEYLNFNGFLQKKTNNIL